MNTADLEYAVEWTQVFLELAIVWIMFFVFVVAPIVVGAVFGYRWIRDFEKDSE